MPMRHTIFVGLSGGVDSAVSAALLKEQGYDVTGVFIKIWQPEFLECTWKEDRLDAMRVCAALDIPFRELDLSEAYKKEVVESMVADYKRGTTPNPDVLCNRAIKFGAFAEWAKAEGAHAIATGHYAQKRDAAGNYELVRAKDKAKDQSYFLYRLRQADLARAMFPVGDLTKAQVRAEAKKFDLPVAGKPDSQGLCFVGEVSMRDFLARYIKVESGAVVDEKGNAIGEHQGAALYTLGQRHGFTTRKRRLPADRQGPYYITGIDVSANIIRVSGTREDAGVTDALLVDESWVYREPTLGRVYRAQARYHEPPVAIELMREGDILRVVFAKPHIASPGQSLVVYDGDVCLGGGTIRQFVADST